MRDRWTSRKPVPVFFLGLARVLRESLSASHIRALAPRPGALLGGEPVWALLRAEADCAREKDS